MHPYHHVVTQDHETLTIFPNDGGSPLVVTNDHPHYDALLAGTAAPDVDSADLRALADLTVAVAEKFERLTERVAVANGRVYFDGDEVDNALTDHMRRFLEMGADDWKPLARFMENIAENQNDHSREMLYDWLAARDFTITEDGRFIAYKGVAGNETDGYRSVNGGTAIVNGETKTGQIPNAVGDIIEMPRSEVAHAPEVGCSTGLHVGTYDYAQSWAQGAMLKVIINPRDVVSVPNDGAGEKMRVCRYTVDDIIDAPETAPVVYNERTDDMSPVADWDEIEDEPDDLSDDRYYEEADEDICDDPDCICHEGF